MEVTWVHEKGEGAVTCLMGAGFQFGVMADFGTRWLHSILSVINAIKLYAKIWLKQCILCFFFTTLKKKQKTPNELSS